MNRADANLIISALRACLAAAKNNLPEHVKTITIELAIFIDCLADPADPICIDIYRQRLRGITESPLERCRES